MYKIICMSFDGDYQTEKPEFETINEAWEYSNDLGSKWFFYPFHFVVNITGKTIRDTFEFLEGLNGLRVKTVAEIFRKHSEKPETDGMDSEAFLLSM